ncbi:MAG: 2-C-methyl-D-erythritol 4-phosphate cytidylyltransferase [Bacteroides sp.]|nr:2-C-methyl-D-erythritol 4-phosphate cytidylyltransferase [Bacteroidales bacterium]MBD5425492.1 2-C-methyl-D-erythritol 4-phosphate cytidylyltransferase [Bacteroides sp.]
MKSIVIIAAGGVGSRFGAAVPKQFCELEGQTVLSHAIECFRRALPEAVVAVVIDPAWQALLPEGVIAARPGATRWESVANALEATGEVEADVILVHDGARPLTTRPVIDAVISALADHQGAIPVVDVTDSLRRADGSPANRAEFRAVQTPQGFRADLLRRAYQLPYSPEFTDDASVMTAAGFGNIALTPGDPTNIKITNPLDLEIARVILRSRS